MAFSWVPLNLLNPKYSCNALCRSNRFLADAVSFVLTVLPAFEGLDFVPGFFAVDVPITQKFLSHLLQMQIYLRYSFLSDHNTCASIFFAQPELSSDK